MNRILLKTASVLRSRWAVYINYTKYHNLLSIARSRLWRGPKIDGFLNYLDGWYRLQSRPRIRSPETLNDIILVNKIAFPGDMTLVRRIVDKIEFKAWLNETPAWRPLIVQTLAVFDTPRELRARVFDAGTILKPTHMSGAVLIVENRRRLTDQELEQFEQWYKLDFYKLTREPVYKGLTPRIILEPLLRDQDGLPPADYKFFMIGDRPLMIQLDRDRHTNHTRQFRSPDWELLDIKFKYPPTTKPFARPSQLDAAFKVASDLARPFPFCRVDLYLLPDGAIKAGEITFIPESGGTQILPVKANFELGRTARALGYGKP